MGLGKIINILFYFNFFSRGGGGGILLQRQVLIFERSMTFSIVYIPFMAYLKKIKFHLSEEQFFKSFSAQTKKNDGNATK
jgi:hypothetical protein